jgi:hypothetical protein
VPVVGVRRRQQLNESLGGSALSVDAADLARIDAAISPDLSAEARYDPARMAHLDSEAHNSREQQRSPQ